MRHLEREFHRYVVATLDRPTKYFYSFNGTTMLVHDISRCTKATSVSIAQCLLDDFYETPFAQDIDAVILPVIISYELVEE